MVDYLEVNRELPKDNDAVGEALLKLDDKYEHELHLLDHRYQMTGYATMFIFTVNTVVSAVPIIDNRITPRRLPFFSLTCCLSFLNYIKSTLL